MSEEQQAAVTADAPEVQTESAANEPVQNEATQENTEQKQERDQDELPKGVRKSIDRLTRQRYQAEARAEMAERRIAELEAKQTPQPAVQAQPQAPTLEQFGGDWEKFIEAKAEYVAERKISERDRIQSQRIDQQRAQQTEQQVAQVFHAEVRKAQDAYPDFVAVMEDSEAQVNPVMQRAIFALGEKGPDVAYHLAKHPEEAANIARLDPYSAVAAIGQISASVQRPSKKQSNAPAPVSSVSAKAQVNVKSDDLSEREYWARREADRKKSR